MLKVIPREYFDDSKGTLKLLWEEEWRGLGITQVGELSGIQEMRSSANTSFQSLGWEHYEVHEPEPHILLFK
jgi:cyclin-dependent kinase regulatory subunit CKS1